MQAREGRRAAMRDIRDELAAIDRSDTSRISPHERTRLANRADMLRTNLAALRNLG